MANFWQQIGDTIFWGNGKRKIGNVLNGTADSDAATVGQVNSIISDGITTDFVRTDIVIRSTPLSDPIAGIDVDEYGDGKDFKAVIAFSDLSLGAVAATGDEVIGVKIYDYPSGEIVQHYSYMNVALTATTQTSDTPDIGLGTDNADGDAVATLDLADGGSGDAENVLTGQTAADCDGTPTVKTTITPLIITSLEGRGLYLNVANSWTDADEEVLASGTVCIKYTIMS